MPTEEQCEADGCEFTAVTYLPTPNEPAVCEKHYQEYKESEIDIEGLREVRDGR